MDDCRYFTLEALAERLSVHRLSVRKWIQEGLIEAPPTLPVSGVAAYPARSADKIERWFLERMANGRSRGPGAGQRRERARAALADA